MMSELYALPVGQEQDQRCCSIRSKYRNILRAVADLATGRSTTCCPTMCSPAFWNLLCANHDSAMSWLARCRALFGRLCQFRGRLGLSDDASWDDWMMFISLDDRWKGKIKETIDSCVQFRCANVDAVVWRVPLQSAFDHVSLNLPVSSVQKSSETDEPWPFTP